MHNAVAKSFAVLLAASLLATPALAQTLSVKTPAGEATFTAAQLEAMPRTKVTVGAGASALAYEGVAVGALLARTGLVSGDDVHGQAFANTVVVRSRDGYLAVLSLAETNPTVRKEPVIVADRMNGAKIDDREGPLRLVVGGDLRQARSARQVSSIEVRPVAP
jgi:DMSO/TMAO reductase YedYZ molybdopterin-dependent catalytic subunit